MRVFYPLNIVIQRGDCQVAFKGEERVYFAQYVRKQDWWLKPLDKMRYIRKANRGRQRI